MKLIFIAISVLFIGNVSKAEPQKEISHIAGLHKNQYFKKDLDWYTITLLLIVFGNHPHIKEASQEITLNIFENNHFVTLLQHCFDSAKLSEDELKNHSINELPQNDQANLFTIKNDECYDCFYCKNEDIKLYLCVREGLNKNLPEYFIAKVNEQDNSYEQILLPHPTNLAKWKDTKYLKTIFHGISEYLGLKDGNLEEAKKKHNMAQQLAQQQLKKNMISSKEILETIKLNQAIINDIKQKMQAIEEKQHNFGADNAACNMFTFAKSFIINAQTKMEQLENGNYEINIEDIFSELNKITSMLDAICKAKALDNRTSLIKKQEYLLPLNKQLLNMIYDKNKNESWPEFILHNNELCIITHENHQLVPLYANNMQLNIYLHEPFDKQLLINKKIKETIDYIKNKKNDFMFDTQASNMFALAKSLIKPIEETMQNLNENSDSNYATSVILLDQAKTIKLIIDAISNAVKDTKYSWSDAKPILLNEIMLNHIYDNICGKNVMPQFILDGTKLCVRGTEDKDKLSIRLYDNTGKKQKLLNIRKSNNLLTIV